MVLEFTEELTAAGLSREESLIYERLLREGGQQASRLAHGLPISRPLIYKILESLIAKGLVEKKDEKGSVAVFLPKHPIGISQGIEAQKEALERARSQFLIASGKLTSLYNLTSGKPGVQYFEGEAGVWEILNDSLTAQEEIRTYADLEAIDAHIPKVNAKYSDLREKRGIKKRGLVVDSPSARTFLRSYDGAVTTTKLIKSDTTLALNTVTQIYDQKISYMTLTEHYLVGIIVTDPFIAQTHKYLFDSLWDATSGEVL
jgi:sugar-specific transcriptional regulator TrmB